MDVSIQTWITHQALPCLLEQSVIKKGASVTQVIAEAANVLTSSLVAPKQSTSASITGNGPSVVIENRSKLYQQLSKLSNLRSANILTEEEYVLEKETIMGLLQKLKESTSSASSK